VPGVSGAAAGGRARPGERGTARAYAVRLSPTRVARPEPSPTQTAASGRRVIALPLARSPRQRRARRKSATSCSHQPSGIAQSDSASSGSGSSAGESRRLRNGSSAVARSAASAPRAMMPVRTGLPGVLPPTLEARIWAQTNPPAAMDVPRKTSQRGTTAHGVGNSPSSRAAPGLITTSVRNG
jgi:hypothetical protein